MINQSHYYLGIFSLIVFGLIMFVWKIKLHSMFSNIDYTGVQKIHSGSTPRLGGLGIFLCMTAWLTVTNNPPELLGPVILAASPFFIISLVEDLTHNTSVLMRFSAIIISSLLAVIFVLNDLPHIDIPFLQNYINTPPVKPLLFILSIAALTNGMNVIDGSNGMVGSVFVTSMITLVLVCIQIGELNAAQFIIGTSVIVLVFLIFNYPLGVIFLGDSGAYLLGFISAVIVIDIYSRHPEIPTWGAFLLIFYPVTEIIFSFFRKIIQNKSPFYPDSKHLHLMVFRLIHKRTGLNLFSNCMVMPALAIIWLTPPVLYYYSYNNIVFTTRAIALSLLLYLLIFWVLITVNRRCKV